MKHSKYIWFDGEMVPWEKATVHVLSHALHYGSSVFEGIRSYTTPNGAAIFRLEDHIQRLIDSAKIYRMDLHYSRAQLEEACRLVVVENGLSSAYLRPLVFKGYGSLGVATQDVPINTIVAAFEWGAYLGEGGLSDGVDTCVSSWIRPSPNSLPAMAKAGGNYLSSQLIVEEANRNGYREGIALDCEGFVSEGSGENIFVVRNGKISTPPVSGSILPGITRHTVMTLAERRGLQITEERIPREALYIADEVFFTGTAAEITPVRSVDRMKVGEGKRGPLTEALQNDFFGLFDGSTPAPDGWLDYPKTEV